MTSHRLLKNGGLWLAGDQCVVCFVCNLQSDRNKDSVIWTQTFSSCDGTTVFSFCLFSRGRTMSRSSTEPQENDIRASSSSSSSSDEMKQTLDKNTDTHRKHGAMRCLSIIRGHPDGFMHRAKRQQDSEVPLTLLESSATYIYNMSAGFIHG